MSFHPYPSNWIVLLCGCSYKQADEFAFVSIHFKHLSMFIGYIGYCLNCLIWFLNVFELRRTGRSTSTQRWTLFLHGDGTSAACSGLQQFHGLRSLLRCIQIPSSPRWRAKPSSGRRAAWMLSEASEVLIQQSPSVGQWGGDIRADQHSRICWLDFGYHLSEKTGKAWKGTTMFWVMFAVAGELQTIQHQATRRGLLDNTSSTVAGNHDLILGRWFEHFSLLCNAVGCPDVWFTCNHFCWNPWRLSARRRLHDSWWFWI